MVPFRRSEGRPKLQIRNIFKRHFLLNHWSKYKIFSQKCSDTVPHDVIYQNYTSVSTALNKRAARALDKKCLETTISTESLFQIQNNFTSQIVSAWLIKGAARALDKKHF